MKNIRLGSSEFTPIYNGENILECRIGNREKLDNRFIDILVNGDLFLRIERKRKGRSKSRFLNTAFIKKIASIKDLACPRNYEVFKSILEHDKFIKEKLNKDVRERRDSQDEFIDFYNTLKRRWDNIEQLQSKLKLNLLRSDKVGYCFNCFALRTGRSFTKLKESSIPTTKKQNCDICKNDIKYNRIIKCLPDPLQEYITGPWFEDYIAEKLEKIGWKVWPQIFVYGSSGAKFEVDVLAIKSGYSLLVECKTGGVGLRDLSTFLAKFYDIKTNLALFISLASVDKQLKTMVQKNPSFKLFDNITNDRSLNAKLKGLLKT